MTDPLARTDDAAETTGRVTASLRAVLSNLYRIPQAEHRQMSNASTNGVLQSALYRRLRPWIIAHRLERQTIAAVKLVHTAIFTVLMSFVVYVSYSGLRNRFSRVTRLSLGAVVIEGIVVTLNQGRCPLTIVVEDLGAEHGSVSDIFLPAWFAQHIPHISSSLIGLGLAAFALRRMVGR